jgi:hypothetical protein
MTNGVNIQPEVEGSYCVGLGAPTLTSEDAPRDDQGTEIKRQTGVKEIEWTARPRPGSAGADGRVDGVVMFSHGWAI